MDDVLKWAGVGDCVAVWEGVDVVRGRILESTPTRIRVQWSSGRRSGSRRWFRRSTGALTVPRTRAAQPSVTPWGDAAREVANANRVVARLRVLSVEQYHELPGEMRAHLLDAVAHLSILGIGRVA